MTKGRRNMQTESYSIEEKSWMLTRWFLWDCSELRGANFPSVVIGLNARCVENVPSIVCRNTII